MADAMGDDSIPHATWTPKQMQMLHVMLNSYWLNSWESVQVLNALFYPGQRIGRRGKSITETEYLQHVAHHDVAIRKWKRIGVMALWILSERGVKDQQRREHLEAEIIAAAADQSVNLTTRTHARDISSSPEPEPKAASDVNEADTPGYISDSTPEHLIGHDDHNQADGKKHKGVHSSSMARPHKALRTSSAHDVSDMLQTPPNQRTATPVKQQSGKSRKAAATSSAPQPARGKNVEQRLWSQDGHYIGTAPYQEAKRASSASKKATKVSRAFPFRRMAGSMRDEMLEAAAERLGRHQPEVIDVPRDLDWNNKEEVEKLIARVVGPRDTGAEKGFK